MNILITGAAGAIGSHVAEALARAGHTVRGVDSFDPYYDRGFKEINVGDIKKAGVQFVEADLCTADLVYLIEGADVIYHFAAQPGLAAHVPFSKYVDNNIIATQRLLEAIKQVGSVKLFVHASTSSVYGKQASGDETTEPKPTSYYGVTKLAGEQLALAYHREQGVPVVVLRLFSVYGERDRPEKLYHKFINSVLNKKSFTLYEGAETHVRSYTHIADGVDSCLLVLEKRQQVVGEIFNIGNDKTISTGEGIAILEHILGEKANITRMPARSGDQIETAANISKARRLLGYDPKIRPEEGLTRQVVWYRAKVHGKI